MDKLNEKEIEILKEMAGALDEVRNCIKDNMAKYHCSVLSTEYQRDTLIICEKVQKILDNMNVSLPELGKARHRIMQAMDETAGDKIANKWHNEIFELITVCSDKLYALADNDGRKVIRIKYTDFYGEFVPEEHWLYKLLIKKYNVVFSDTPDYLFFSCFGSNYLNYNCIRIFISNEAVYPNFNLYDYAVTYSDFEVTDRLLPNMDAFEDLEFTKLADGKEQAKEVLARKKDFCNFVYSNGERDPYCMELFRQINDYKKVTSGGRFLNNTGHKVEDIFEFQSGFKFSISCENSYYKGYTTEKIVNALRARTIPIYWGNPDVSNIINSKAIINCHEYDSIEDVVKEVVRLDNDDEAYMEKLQQPIFVDDNFREEYLRKREDFIYHILDQKYFEAIRRNTGLRGQWINDWFCCIYGYTNEWFSEEKGYFVKRKPDDSTERLTDGPLVSVLIPVYNRGQLVLEAVESALEQTYSNIEIIICDNCSTDGTYDILCKNYANHPKVKLYQNEKNLGPVNNWIQCLQKATGKYVKILWSDDLISSQFIEKCVAVMEKDDDIGMVYSSCILFSDREMKTCQPLHKLPIESGKYDKDIFYQGTFVGEWDLPVSPGCALFRREDVTILREIPNGYGINCNSTGAGIDLLIFLFAMEKHKYYYYYDQPMSFFRYHAGSITISNNLTREYNLARLYFCKISKDAYKYYNQMCKRVIRDEKRLGNDVGEEIIEKYEENFNNHPLL